MLNGGGSPHTALDDSEIRNIVDSGNSFPNMKQYLLSTSKRMEKIFFRMVGRLG